jgi:hypothetical protein
MAFRSRKPTSSAVTTKKIPTAIPVTINPFIADPNVSRLWGAALIKLLQKGIKKTLTPALIGPCATGETVAMLDQAWNHNLQL